MTITGTNDAAIITGQTSGSAAETNALVTITGTLSATDVDNTAGFQAETLTGSKGTLSITSAGAWSFTANSAFDALNVGQTEQETFTVKSVDGTTGAITVTITGTNDAATAPVIFAGTGDSNDFDGLLGVATNGFTLISDTNNINSFTFNGNTNEIVNALGGNDLINAGNGTDQVYGGTGNDTINGGSAVDKLYGQAGTDTINGDSDDDLIYGGSDNDILLNGNSGSDTIYGGSGNDTINGGDGADLIIGGFGADTLTGDTAGTINIDTFKYIDFRDTGDTITDFKSGTDKIDFSALDANITTPILTNNEAFVFSGTTLSANSVSYYFDGGNTIVQADSDGNVVTAEIQIQLTGNIALTAADFIL